MFTVETWTWIDRSPGDVFAFVADQTNAPTWQHGLHHVRRVTPGPLGVGSEHVFARRFAGRLLESRNRFLRYEPPRLVEFEIPEGWLSGQASYEVEPRDGASLLIGRMHFGANGPARVLEPLLRRILTHDARRDDARLKAVLERRDHRTKAQDGPKSAAAR